MYYAKFYLEVVASSSTKYKPHPKSFSFRRRTLTAGLALNRLLAVAPSPKGEGWGEAAVGYPSKN